MTQMTSAIASTRPMTPDEMREILDDISDGGPGVSPFPEPEDRGTAVLSPAGGVEYAEDLLKAERLLAVCAEEGTGKTFAAYELAIRFAVARGSFAGTWAIKESGNVLYVSEMHPDDDYAYEQQILDSLEIERASLSEHLWRLDLNTAANGNAVLDTPDWREHLIAKCLDLDIKVVVFDTATNATQAEPWGLPLRTVIRDLRTVIDRVPGLAIVLTMHLKKPQGQRSLSRRITDVMGDWGKWSDVILLMEDDGSDRTKLTTMKRVANQRRITALRRGGLLVEPQDISDKAGPKVPLETVIETVRDNPNVSYAELGELLGVSKRTAQNYVVAAGDAIDQAPTGPRGQIRLFVADTEHD